VFLHYQPYWGAQPGQFARTQEYKLYRNGGLFHVPEDIEESSDLNLINYLDQSGNEAERLLSEVLSKAPPAPTEPGSRTTVERPTYADWPLLNH
jgi:arylsulfatase A